MHLELKLDLVRLHINVLDRVLIWLRTDNDIVSNVSRSCAYHRERRDSDKHYIDELHVERRRQDRVESLVLRLQLLNRHIVLQFGLVDLSEELMEQLQNQHSEKWLIHPDQCQEDTRRESHQAADDGHKAGTLVLGGVITVHG